MARIRPPPVYGVAKSILFRMDPERAHHVAARWLGAAHRHPSVRATVRVPPASGRLATTIAGLELPSPLGMAAGFDKDAAMYNALLAMGFGHVELGTVTLRAQPGNPKPRVHRFPQQQALVNAMGFPGPGVDAVVARLKRHPPEGTVGANIGPNKDTTLEQIPADLRSVATELTGLVDYLAINVSSPNTPGLRKMQEPKRVAALVSQVVDVATKPVFLKLHPDASNNDLVAVARAAVDAGAEGIIAVNTTRERVAGTESQADGGLSGAPLHARACEVIGALHQGLGRDAPIVGVGGMFTGEDVFAAMQAGAAAVQAYTGFIYRGPRMGRLVQQELLACMDAAGVEMAADIVHGG